MKRGRLKEPAAFVLAVKKLVGEPAGITLGRPFPRASLA